MLVISRHRSKIGDAADVRDEATVDGDVVGNDAVVVVGKAEASVAER